MFRLFNYAKKNRYLNQATTQDTWQIFLTKKILESKISNPKKSFDHHPRHLKSPGDLATVDELASRSAEIVLVRLLLEAILRAKIPMRK